MERSECHYLFNKLYLDPLIGWIQQCEESEVFEFGNELSMIANHDTSIDSKASLFGKKYLGLGLDELEQAYFESNASDTSSSDEAECSDGGDDDT